MMTDADLCKIVADLVKDAEAYRDDRSKDNQRAQEYYDGEMSDTPSDNGRSKVVSRDLRAEIKKVMPSIKRTLLRAEKVVEYLPVGQEDEESAKQATDYVNYIAFPESDGKKALSDAIMDALLLRNGVVKWWQEVKYSVKTSSYTGLDEMAFTQLVADDSVEVLEHTAREEQVELNGQMAPVPVHDVKIRRKTKKSKPKVSAVAMENFLIHPDAIEFQDAPLLGENYRIRRSALVEMGYDRKLVDELPIAGGKGTQEQDAEADTRRRDVLNREEQTAKAMQEVEYYDLLVRVDYDDDGIAELRRVCFAGGLQEKYLLENEEWDEVNYADIVCEHRPHQWQGNSAADDVNEIQKIKTVLLRQTLDNLYWQNNLQPIVQEGAVVNPEAVTNPTFGLPIRVGNSVDVRAAVGYNIVPFVADKSFAMMEYLDQEKHDRTGVNDASAGLAPDALQNATAKATALIEQAGIGQTEELVGTVADSIKPVFTGLLKLICKHQDIPRTVRLRKKWVTFDPRQWNADMDVTVNTGLGAGTRERDVMMMQIVLGLQEKLLTAFGPNNPYVKPDQIYNAIAKMVEASGLKAVDQYFTNPSPEELQQFMQAMAQKKSPEQEKAEGQVMVEKAKGEVQVAIANTKMQSDAVKEREQRDADLIVKKAELEKDTQIALNEAAISAQDKEADRALEREKIASNERIALAKIEADAALKREEMDRADQRAERDRQAQAAMAAQRQPEMVQ
jgi:hypothetical protein